MALLAILSCFYKFMCYNRSDSIKNIHQVLDQIIVEFVPQVLTSVRMGLKAICS